MSASPSAAIAPPAASRLPETELLRIALAAARFPRSVPAGERLAPADLERIAHRFPGFLAARLPGFAALAARPGRDPGAEDMGLGAALRAWAASRPAGPGESADTLARRLGVPPEAGMLAAAALPAYAGMARSDLPGLAELDAPGPGPLPLSRLFRLFAVALRLRRPDMFDAPGMEPKPGAVLDWCIVFGLSEHGLWPLLPPADRRLLLGGTPTAPPLFLRAVMRFREDLRALAGQPLALRDWLRGAASREYGLTFEGAPPVRLRPGLTTVIGPWRQVLGISDDCFSACCALEALGADYEVVGTDVSRWIETDPDKLAALAHRAAEVPHGDRALFCDTLFQATFWALAHWPRFAAFRRVDLFAPWELPALPEGWQAAARLLFGANGTIMAPSAFARDAFAAAGVPGALRVCSSVELAPGWRHRMADANALRRRGLPPPGRRGAPVFAAIFDFSSWMARKNPEAVLDAFLRLRRQAGLGRAVLVLKTTRGRRARGPAQRLAARIRGAPGVLWLDGAWSNAEVEALLRRADAYVSLHRAEGFGRNIAKALLLGTPVVATHWSGNADMAPEPLYFGVRPARLVPITDADYVLGEGQVWAEPDAREAVRQMRAAIAPRVPRPGRAALRFSRTRLARRLDRVLAE